MKDSIQKILYNKASTTKFCEDTDGEHQSPLRMVAMLEFVNHKVLAVLTAEKDPNHILYLHEIKMDCENSTFTVGNFVEGVHDEQTQLLRLDFHTFESTDPKIIEILAYHKYRTTISPLHGIISTMKDAMMIELGEPKFRFLAKNFLL